MCGRGGSAQGPKTRSERMRVLCGEASSTGRGLGELTRRRAQTKSTRANRCARVAALVVQLGRRESTPPSVPYRVKPRVRVMGPCCAHDATRQERQVGCLDVSAARSGRRRERSWLVCGRQSRECRELAVSILRIPLRAQFVRIHSQDFNRPRFLPVLGYQVLEPKKRRTSRLHFLEKDD
ncbi:hypothetical protein B0H16DRAFT_1470340 [Mycena metata]|uniref:Uncharacterized protein n=1 Tax=Mycena metata TaxID=1033252 RepID=A0AAD7HWJ9_9AGAR|nr:hypothetical protein B0H16DRAFT_1470340 [Mycena metata]